MKACVLLLFSAPLLFLTPNLGLSAQLVLLLLMATIFFSGQTISRIAGIDEPFLGFVIGFAVVSHILMVAEMLAPAGTWPLAIILCSICFVAFKKLPPAQTSLNPLVLALLVSAFTYIWCSDLPSRLSQFQKEGKLDFWIDIIVHAATIAQFSAENMMGRGMALMADISRPLYHTASYMPAAMIGRVLLVPPLDVAVLIWIPMGVLTMATGIVALGLALKSARLAMLALAVIALVPNPEQFPLKNPLLGFSWLLETAPGTPYALGISCAAIATLVYWIRHPRPALLAIIAFLTASCFLIRINVFILLAPVIALGFIAGLSKLTVLKRSVLIAAGVAGLCGFFIIISWKHFQADPAKFLFAYVEMVHLSQTPTAYEGFYSWLLGLLGRSFAAPVGIGLLLFGILGPWLPIFAISTFALLGKRKLQAEDTIPFILLTVAIVAITLAPIPQNGDISEFRHRGGPILVVIISIWSLRFAGLAIEPFLLRWHAPTSWKLPVFVATISFAVMAMNISSARYPRMDWAREIYGRQFSPVLLQLSSVLKARRGEHLQFAIADQPRDARNIDDAAVLVAMSGMPAYISCPQSLLLRDDYVGSEAARRMEVIEQMAKASSFEELRTMMRAENIAYYIVTNSQQAHFDRTYDSAFWKGGEYAIYSAQ
ncbi:hypothetical protein [Agrobacterium tumefaciens]|uniref:hypothetical protein n=1 Tax=Agrobacterium tumefaciens TaxID=358 RepID=UPI000200AF8C|nr:hypothetical protein [Agrobacterium tumefaciens]ADY66002.1 hypothetical protein AGROH133_09903 [Agrobacterium tumefaciens]